MGRNKWKPQTPLESKLVSQKAKAFIDKKAKKEIEKFGKYKYTPKNPNGWYVDETGYIPADIVLPQVWGRRTGMKGLIQFTDDFVAGGWVDVSPKGDNPWAKGKVTLIKDVRKEEPPKEPTVEDWADKWLRENDSRS